MDHSKAEVSMAEDVQPEPTQANSVIHEDSNDRLNVQTILALAALSIQYNSYLLTLLMPSTILAYINTDLGPDPNYTWITVSWNLGAAVLVTVGGRLADIFGRRYFLITGSVIGCVGALVGATGKSINQMIASGVLFGIGGGFQEMCYACIQELVPNKYRLLAIGLFELSALLSFVSPMIAYAMLANTLPGWRTIYWFIFAFEVVGLGLLIVFYRPPTFETKHKYDGKTKWQLIRQLDYVGLFLFTSGLILLLLGVNWGGRGYAWNSAAVITTLVLGAVLLVILGFWEAYAHLEYPILPPVLFKRLRSFTSVLVVCFVGGMLYYSMNVLWPRQSALLFVPSNDTVIRGVYSNMVSFGTILAGVITVGFCQKVGHERWQLVGFMAIQTALIGSLSSVGVNDKTQAIVTIIILSAMVTPPQLVAFAMVSLGIPDQVDIGVANGLASTFRLLGGAIATAIYSAILSSKFTEVLPGQIQEVANATNFPQADIPALIAAAAVGTTDAFNKVPHITPQVISAAALAVKQSYVQAFKLVYLIAIAFGVTAIICSLFTKSIPLEIKSSKRAVRLENERKVEEDDEKVTRS